MIKSQDLLGVGIYTVPDAAFITGVSKGRIRRWLRGYRFKTKKAYGESPAVWSSDLPVLDGALALSFRDLMEVRFVDYFLAHGVTWPTLRRAAQYASTIVESTHPFSTQRFRTDGYRIFAEFGQRPGEKQFLDVITTQFNMPEFIESRLYAGLEFADDDHIERWFPMHPDTRVMVDPAIAFGQPVVNPEGVPTAILARAVEVEGSVSRVSHWYQVRQRSVVGAVRFHNELAKAA